MAAGSTYVPIQSVTLTTTSATVTFGSGGTIPQSYTDLMIVSSGGNTTSDHAIYVQMGNNSIDSGNNYSYTVLYGNGSSASSTRGSNINVIPTMRFNNTLGYGFGYAVIQNYSNSTSYKTVLSRGNSNNYALAYVGTWRSTAAVNIITLTDEGGGSFLAGSTFTLYGIAAA